MNFDLSEDQQIMRENFSRFLSSHGSPTQLRSTALAGGFDPKLWQGLAELGAFSLRVPEEAGGLGLGVFDAAVLMEEVGRSLAAGPIAETLVATRLLSMFEAGGELLQQAVAGQAVVSLAFQDLAAWQDQNRFPDAPASATKFDNITEPLLRFRVSDNFWKRRGYQKAYTEWKVYMKGGYALNGLSFNMGLASFRFVFRLFPAWLVKFIYRSRLRT